MEFLNIFSKLADYKRAPRQIFGLSPESDWRIILIASITLVILVIGLSVGIFIKIDKGEIFVVKESEDTTENALNTSLLQRAATYYQDKAVTFEEIKAREATATDPSL